jgi:hypothetical protein
MSFYLPVRQSSNPATPESPGGTPYSANPEPSQTVTKLLLLAIFAIADRYLENNIPPNPDAIWEAGNDYLAQARIALGNSSPRY